MIPGNGCKEPTWICGCYKADVDDKPSVQIYCCICLKSTVLGAHISATRTPTWGRTWSLTGVGTSPPWAPALMNVPLLHQKALSVSFSWILQSTLYHLFYMKDPYVRVALGIQTSLCLGAANNIVQIKVFNWEKKQYLKPLNIPIQAQPKGRKIRYQKASELNSKHEKSSFLKAVLTKLKTH